MIRARTGLSLDVPEAADGHRPAEAAAQSGKGDDIDAMSPARCASRPRA
ncbi:MAG: hypothetical protein U5P41_13295 [Gammaproteobacteria bacterium]|nr:hypothetical protein [Gammaproteobacteria bacterium]